MRTAIAARELLPKGLLVETLSIGSGRVSISVSSGTTRSFYPLCGRCSSRAHSRSVRSGHVPPLFCRRVNGSARLAICAYPRPDASTSLVFTDHVEEGRRGGGRARHP